MWGWILLSGLYKSNDYISVPNIYFLGPKSLETLLSLSRSRKATPRLTWCHINKQLILPRCRRVEITLFTHLCLYRVMMWLFSMVCFSKSTRLCNTTSVMFEHNLNVRIYREDTTLNFNHKSWSSRVVPVYLSYVGDQLTYSGEPYASI